MSEIEIIDEALAFNEMPPAARAWLVARRAKLLANAIKNLTT